MRFSHRRIVHGLTAHSLDVFFASRRPGIYLAWNQSFLWEGGGGISSHPQSHQVETWDSGYSPPHSSLTHFIGTKLKPLCFMHRSLMCEVLWYDSIWNVTHYHVVFWNSGDSMVFMLNVTNCWTLCFHCSVPMCLDIN